MSPSAILLILASVDARRFMLLPFSLEVGLLLIIEPLCCLLEPEINIFFVYFLLHEPPFIKQRDNRPFNDSAYTAPESFPCIS